MDLTKGTYLSSFLLNVFGTWLGALERLVHSLISWWAMIWNHGILTWGFVNLSACLMGNLISCLHGAPLRIGQANFWISTSPSCLRFFAQSSNFPNLYLNPLSRTFLLQHSRGMEVFTNFSILIAFHNLILERKLHLQQYIYWPLSPYLGSYCLIILLLPCIGFNCLILTILLGKSYILCERVYFQCILFDRWILFSTTLLNVEVWYSHY